MAAASFAKPYRRPPEASPFRNSPKTNWGRKAGIRTHDYQYYASKNGGTAWVEITTRSNLTVGPGWNIGSGIGSGSGTAFRVFRGLQIANLSHPHHVFIRFPSRRKINNAKLSHLSPLSTIDQIFCYLAVPAPDGASLAHTDEGLVLRNRERP